MGTGALPVDGHRRRPPIPIAGIDEPARASALARDADPLAVWLSGVTGADPPPVRARVVAVADAGPPPAAPAGIEAVTLTPPLTATRDSGAGPAMTVGEVALAVDTGRDAARGAAAAGATLLLIRGAASPREAAAAGALAAVLGEHPDEHAAATPRDPAAARAVALHGPHVTGPLGALRRLGTPGIAVLCGLALGAGEAGLGCVCDGPAALAAAAVAAGIEPDLRARLIASSAAADPDSAALLHRLGIPAVLGHPAAGAADAALHRVAAVAA